jgi:hypothetical protein
MQGKGYRQVKAAENRQTPRPKSGLSHFPALTRLAGVAAGCHRSVDFVQLHFDIPSVFARFPGLADLLLCCRVQENNVRPRIDLSL